VAPYYLTWGSSIYAKVIAKNIIGNSVESLAGNGAIILTYPDVPINLANVPSVTKSSQIGILWNEGTQNGGSSVIDYTITFGESIGSYT
jgi:hypothetical protein